MSRLFLLVLVVCSAGCVPNTMYNTAREDYLICLPFEGEEGAGADIAIIEFDEFGGFWNLQQLEDTIDLILERNANSEHGVLVSIHVHGWLNNADPEREDGDLYRFQGRIADLHERLMQDGPRAPDQVIGVFLAWRGATNRFPLFETLSFWDRKDAAERVASYNIRETFFRLIRATKDRPESKVLVSGHSMGGMIVGRTLGPSLSTMLLAVGEEGVTSLADMVVLQNPALEALTTSHLIDYLKRTGARLELRFPDGRVEEAPGPLMVSITSEADWVTRVAYPAGQGVDHLFDATRSDQPAGVPSQRTLLTHAHGHVDHLISHRAWVDAKGELILEPVEGAYNDTMFWIVSVSEEISKDHGDIANPYFYELVERITKLNLLYETGVQPWIRADNHLHGMDAPSAIE